MTILLITISVFLMYLVYERAALDRLRKSVPLVIAVTGTRGKSTVVRGTGQYLRNPAQPNLVRIRRMLP